jgi:hypothetical protein
MTDKRNTIVRDQKPNSTKIELTSAAALTPGFYQSEYPNFIAFLEKYLEYIRDTEGFGDLIEKLRDIRNIDVTEEEYAEIMKSFEYGKDFPNLASVDDSLAIRVFEYWYKSKGTRAAIETYFQVFLNSEATIEYPKDNILIVDGGDYNSSTLQYNNVNSHIDETTMVIQDDFYYQIYSYLVKSGVSFNDWGVTFQKVAHPAGWNVFGEVQITSLAQFPYLTRSPTIQPGFQIADADVLVLGSAAMAMGASAQTVYKIIKHFQSESTFQTYSFEDVNTNLLNGTYTISSFADTPISDFDPVGASTRYTSRQRPARIGITVTPVSLGSELLTNGPGGFSGTTNWSTGTGETATEVSGRLRVTVDATGSVYVSQAVTLNTSKTYRLQGSFSRGTLDDDIFLRVAGSAILSLSSVQTLATFVNPNDGSFSADFTPGVTSMHVGFRVNSGPSIGEYFEIIDISLKEVL